MNKTIEHKDGYKNNGDFKHEKINNIKILEVMK